MKKNSNGKRIFITIVLIIAVIGITFYMAHRIYKLAESQCWEHLYDSSCDINEEFISDNLDTKDIPDPDLLIRTSGEQRISNFLLWQIAYSEFYFADCHWPDFNKDELIKAIEEYNKRDRRFGDAK